jgi:maleate isomerase
MTLGEISPHAVDDMISEGLRAVRELASAEVALIAECCTVSTLIKGREFEEKMIQDFEREAGGIRVTTATTSIIRAFEQLNMKRIVIAHPYPEAFDEWAIKYFTECGIEVPASKGMGIVNVVGPARPSPEEIYHFAKSAWTPEADGLFISCFELQGPGRYPGPGE